MLQTSRRILFNNKNCLLLPSFSALSNLRCSRFVTQTKKKDYFKPCYVLLPKPIKQWTYTVCAPKLQWFTQSEMCNCFRCQRSMAAFSPTGPHWEMGGQGWSSHLQTLLWVINTSACLPSSFLLHRGELGLHSVNLSLQACLLLHWPAGEQRRGMKEG